MVGIPGGGLAKVGAAYAVTKSALGALGQYFSLFLIIVGLLHFIFIRGGPLHELAAIIMFILGTVATVGFFRNSDFWEGSPPIHHTLGAWITATAFLFWYFPGGRTASSLLYTGIIWGILLVIYGLIATKGEGTKAFAFGLIPVIFFFMDVAAAWLFGPEMLNWRITEGLQTLIFYVPWWTLLGWILLPTKNALVNIVKIVGLILLVLVVIGPFLPAVGHESAESLIPGTQGFLEAERQLQERLPRQENPFISNLRCITAGRYEDLPACVEERRVESELRSLCEDRAEEEDREATDTYLESCIEEERVRTERERIQVSGITDPTIKEPLEIKFEKGDFFPDKTYRRESEQSRIRYPLDLVIKNPRQQAITIAVSCGFEKTSGEEVVAGRIIGPAEFTIAESSKTQTIVCEPEAALDGSYKLNYTARFLHLQTFSRLTRAFIGEPPEDSAALAERALLRDEIRDAHFPGSTAQSQAPNDPVQLHFALGNPVDNPIVEGESGLLLAAAIKNEGRGEILRINRYSLFLPGLAVDDTRCLEAFDVEIPAESRLRGDIHLPLCSILSLPFELKDPGEQEYYLREFTAELDYDYALTEEVRVEQEVIS